MLSKAVFLDKDGTLIENVPYNVDPSLIRLTEGAAVGLQVLHAAGFRLIIISNQSGVARGKFPEEALGNVNDHLCQIFTEIGVTLTGFYYCPHHPEGTVNQYAISCFCRKPSPGLIFQAAREHGLNLSTSWFVGDILNDVEAGRRADCRTVLIDNGNETEWKHSPLRQPHYSVPDLLTAARAIVDIDQAQLLAQATTGRLRTSAGGISYSRIHQPAQGGADTLRSD